MAIIGAHMLLYSTEPEALRTIELPGGVEVLCYEPRHQVAISESPRPPRSGTA